MKRMLFSIAIASSIFAGFAVLDVQTAPTEETSSTAAAPQIDTDVLSFLTTHCAECHGEYEQEADLTVHDLTGNVASGEELIRWEKIHEMLSLGLMPPASESQPNRHDTDRVVAWITAELTKIGRAPDPLRLQMPSFGNRVRHEDLFSGEHTGSAFSYSRLWRVSPEIYEQMATDNGITRGGNSRLDDALARIDGHGIQDFALLRADEGTLRVLVTSSRTIAVRMTVGLSLEGNRFDPPRILRDDKKFRYLVMLDAEQATNEELDHALNRAFEELMQRPPTPEERERYGEFLRESVDVGGPMLGFQNLLMALLMSPEFIFRMELGFGEQLSDGRRMLAPQEIAYALSYALTDRPPDDALLAAVAEEKLSTRTDVEHELRRMLAMYDDVHTHFTVPMNRPGSHVHPYNVRILRFFREFFGYAEAEFVFKDMEHSERRYYDALQLVNDADRFVLEILDRDEDVFRELLTSDRYFAAYVAPQYVEREIKGLLEGGHREANEKNQALIDSGHYPVPHRYGGYIQAYNLHRDTWSWEREQPFKVPHRAGMLTHPAWLVAHSGNFDNDPIRRGKWIREHLLADSIPDLPIGVDAKLPEDPHRTLRERLEVTRVDECWRCHRQMNPLGLPFEEYDDFGTYREEIILGDADAYRRDRHNYENRKHYLEFLIAQWSDFPTHRANNIAERDAALENLNPPDPADGNFEQRNLNYERDLAKLQEQRETWRAMSPEQAEANLARLRRELEELVEPIAEAKPVDDTTVLTGTGDPDLDGEVDGAIELVHRLAESDRVRQSIIRHVFRYWMGRNETLNDSPTLMAMDQAYLDSGGSFNELLVALLTSDSFLYRKDQGNDG